MPIDDVLRILRAMRRRMHAVAFLRFVSRGLLWIGFLLLFLAAAQMWLAGRIPWSASFYAWSAAFVVGVTLVRILATRVPLRSVAQSIDRLGGTRDRFLTALDFAENETSPGMRELAVRECRAFFAGRDFRSLIQPRIPRDTAWILVPAISLALLHWHAQTERDLQKAEALAAQAEVAGTAAQLEKLARETKKNAEETKDAELAALAERFKQSAHDLRANAKVKEEAAKAAMREISALEQLVEQMRKAPGAISPEELKEIANALAENDTTKDAAAAMQQGNMEEAAKRLEEAMKHEPSAEQAEQTLKQALERLAQQRQLSQALQNLAQELQRQGGSSAMQKLAEMLRQMPQNQKSQQPRAGKPLTQEQLEKLLAALQNMKAGEGGEPQDGEGDGDGEGRISIESFGKPSPGSQQMLSEAQQPTGLPGTERDTGTTATPFGKREESQGEKGAELALRGRLAEGESLSALIPAGGDASKAGRRYKELYEAMAAEAQEAILQEEIPLGSRFFIKRYFESIRPKE